MSRGGVVSYGRSRGANKHNERAMRCSCGREIYGNGGRWSHRRACDGYYLTHSAAIEARRLAFLDQPNGATTLTARSTHGD